MHLENEVVEYEDLPSLNHKEIVWLLGRTINKKTSEKESFNLFFSQILSNNFSNDSQ